MLTHGEGTSIRVNALKNGQGGGERKLKTEERTFFSFFLKSACHDSSVEFFLLYLFLQCSLPPYTWHCNVNGICTIVHFLITNATHL